MSRLPTMKEGRKTKIIHSRTGERFEIPEECLEMLLGATDSKFIDLIASDAIVLWAPYINIVSYLIEPFGFFMGWYNIFQMARRFVAHISALIGILFCQCNSEIEMLIMHTLILVLMHIALIMFSWIYGKPAELSNLDYVVCYSQLVRSIFTFYFCIIEYGWGFPDTYKDLNINGLKIVLDKNTVTLRHSYLWNSKIKIRQISRFINLVYIKTPKKEALAMKIIGNIRGIYKKEQFFLIFQDNYLISLDYINLRILQSQINTCLWQNICEADDFLYAITPFRKIHRINVSSLNITEFRSFLSFGSVCDIMVYKEKYVFVLMHLKNTSYLEGVDLTCIDKKPACWFIPQKNDFCYFDSINETELKVNCDNTIYKLNLSGFSKGMEKTEYLPQKSMIQRKPLGFKAMNFYSKIQ